MTVHLTDDEVKEAILFWLRAKHMPGCDATPDRIRRLYWTEGAGFDAVIEETHPKCLAQEK
jgi:hypothetical protein